MKTTLLMTLLTMTTSMTLLADTQPGQKVLVNRSKEGLAIQGYDPVAYFTDHRPVKGTKRHTAQYEGAIYWFASEDHQKAFEAAPEKYAPAYGGYCGFAVSIDRLSPISPEWFQILEGRLVLQHNKRAFDKWNADLDKNRLTADKNWPELVTKHGAGGKSLVFTDRKGVALMGYDPVSYFTDGKAMKGNPGIESSFNGALYHFSSQEHRATFELNPTQYIPAYGGYCGYAASIGKVRPADPLLWSIVDGQLIVQHTKGAVDLWEKDIHGNKAKADSLWPRLVEAKSGKKNPIDSLLGKSVLADLN